MILLSLQKLHEPKKQGEPAAVPETSKPTNDKPPSETPPASRPKYAVPNEPEQESDKTDSQTLQQFAESMKNQPKTVTDGTFTLIGKNLHFSERKQGILRLCIPDDLIKETLHQNHDLMGHPGYRRTYMGIRLHYYFPHMSRHVKQYCDDCTICQITHSYIQSHPWIPSTRLQWTSSLT